MTTRFTNALRPATALLAVAALALLAPACGGSKEKAAGDAEARAEHGGDPAADAGAPAQVAVAELAALGGSGVSGRVIFTTAMGQTAVVANVQGLTPGEHGFHVHEVGDCGDAGKAAGGHFNPGSHPHGALTDPESHAGDLGNLTADASGNASTNFVTEKIAVADIGLNNVVGKSVIVHEKADDLASQPTGAAGGRVACGVIKKQDPGSAPAQ